MVADLIQQRATAGPALARTLLRKSVLMRAFRSSDGNLGRKPIDQDQVNEIRRTKSDNRYDTWVGVSDRPR